MNTIDILTIGNLTEDINIINNNVYKSIGGTSFYAYKVAEKLGYDLRIITEISDKLNVSKKINLKKIISQNTQLHTIFENTYLDGKRSQKVLNKPGKIKLKNISKKLENIDPKIIFYCPILNELDSSFFNLFNKSIKICNLQGFMRKTVNQSILIKKNLPNINFKIFDAVILSEIDTNFENALKISSYSKIVCYTMGKKGVKIIIDNEIIAFKTLNVISNDETGAGDVWGTSFIIFYYLMKKDLNESVSLSNISASLSVTGISDKKIPKYNEILKHYNA
ncbi:MAG: hypothetical protein VX114_01640 [Chloroflexota bacterium]|nr:hypothetical protein [Chloroflexota bacterium]